MKRKRHTNVAHDWQKKSDIGRALTYDHMTRGRERIQPRHQNMFTLEEKTDTDDFLKVTLLIKEACTFLPMHIGQN